MKSILPAIALIAIGAALATEPQKWVVSSQREFLKGDLKGVSVSSDGRLILAPALKPIYDTEQAYLFSMAQDSSGAILVGSGNNGKIFRMDSSGGKVFAKVDELAVYALVVDSQNRIYAGSSPDGKLYRFGPDGKATILFDPKEKYIWSLAADRAGNIYVGTGPKGIIYRVSPSGEGQPFYDSQETHITALALDAEGNVLAGSAPSGYVYRIDALGKPFVLFDSPLNEIKGLAIDRYGNIFAVAIGDAARKGSAPSGADSVAPLLSVSTVAVVAADPDGDEDKEPPAASDKAKPLPSASRGDKKSTLLQIDKEGVVEEVYSSDSEVFYNVVVRNDGTLILGTGPKGRLLSIDSRRLVTILVQAPEEQITGVVDREGQLYIATSNLGKVFQLLAKPVESGVYESEPLDARIVSSWGMISWKVVNPTQARIELASRSGNTKSPDKTWSDWSAAYRNPSGSYISSPKARFMQWKITISADARGSGRLISESNMVESVIVSYMQQNVAPKINSVRLETPGVAFQPYPPVSLSGGGASGMSSARQKSLPRSIRNLDTKISSPPPRRIFQAGVQSFTWDARDENDDELEYSLYYRAEGETGWKALKMNLSENHYSLDANTLADGIYYLKVVASDAPSNPYQRALSDEYVSKAFVIDNSPPRVEVLSHKVVGARVEIAFRATTQVSVVYQAEFSIDAGEPAIVFPKDGIADSRSEEYSFTTPELKKGEHSIVLRVFDVVGNTGTNKVVVSIP